MIKRFDKKHLKDSQTGRTCTQITHGEAFCYPLYYFIPSFTDDGQTILFHRRTVDEVQIWKLDLPTGEATQLTRANTPNALWRPWLHPTAKGVRDQLSAFNTVSSELLYFDSNELRAVQIDMLKDRLIHQLDPTRVPCGLTGVSPDGGYFVFPHCDRNWWEQYTSSAPPRHEARDVHLQLIDMTTGESRVVLRINSWITHTNFYDNTRILFSHPATDKGILMTDIDGGWYAHLAAMGGTREYAGEEAGMADGPLLRDQSTSHYLPTALGIAYERRDFLGVVDPDTHACVEYQLADYPSTHIGRDPLGKQWFYDSRRFRAESGMHDGPRCLLHLPELDRNKVNRPELIYGGSEMFGVCQASHMHPVIMPDRKHILMTIGDSNTRTNHLAILDISDLPETRRI